MTYIFFEGNIVFTFYILLVSFLLAGAYKKRDNFIKRFFISIAAMIPPVVGITLLYQHFSMLVNYETVGFNLISLCNYILLFALTIIVLFVLFDESIWQLILCAFTAYACQHIVSKIEYIIRTIFDLGYLYTSTDIKGMALATAFQLTVFGVSTLILYFLFIRKSSKSYAKGSFSIQTFLTSLLTFAVVLVLNLFAAIYGEGNVGLNIVCAVFSIICSIFILLLYSGIIKNNRLEWEKDLIEQMWSKDKLQYELTKDNIDMINAKCHDLRKRIDLFQDNQQLMTKEEIQELKDEISIYDSVYKSGNHALDTVLTSYRIYCDKRGIVFTCIADGKILNFMSSSDIYSLLSNIISNAVEATQKINDKEKKVISLIIKKVNGIVVLREENYFVGELNIKDGCLQTSKEDASAHGVGTKSMKILVEKYNGTITYKSNNGKFLSTITFPSKNE